MRKNIQYTVFLLVVTLSVLGCRNDLPPNPFDDPSLQPSPEDSNEVQLDPTSFAGLHANIFKPTCANSGCHDGTFEPDFRTIESAYNTLVYHPVVKNNASGHFTYRVDPFSVSTSVLIERLVNDIDGISGIMPLSVDPDSDWNQMKTTHIEHIKQWINNGAKDIFGNYPSKGNQEPQMRGVVAFVSGSSTAAPRKPGNGAIQIPVSASSLEIWFALSDDSTAVNSLSHNKIKYAVSRDDFSSATEEPLTVQPTALTETGYFGDPVPYYHKVVLNNPAQYGGAGTKIYFRIYVKDPQHDVTEIPETGSFNYIKEYFAIELI